MGKDRCSAAEHSRLDWIGGRLSEHGWQTEAGRAGDGLDRRTAVQSIQWPVTETSAPLPMSLLQATSSIPAARSFSCANISLAGASFPLRTAVRSSLRLTVPPTSTSRLSKTVCLKTRVPRSEHGSPLPVFRGLPRTIAVAQSTRPPHPNDANPTQHGALTVSLKNH